jgi:epoxyqueuosine reductase
MMDLSLTDKIKSKALEIGFSAIGITQAVSLAEEAENLSEWLRKKYHAGMKWMENESGKRTDPRSVLPGARSVVCVGMNYYSPEQHSMDPEAGKISRYAWGDDYHEIVSERLNVLLEFIKSEVPSVVGKFYVDTGPVMDKAWAVRAGIGWMGKHTNIINRTYGSWIFLGELILDIVLKYDEPIMDLCGTCTACIDACPTQAIVQPYVLDSNKCISYLTIEHRDELPKGLIPKFHNWIFGCDICQDVCPWNRFQKETEEPLFRPRMKNIAPVLADVAALSQEEFSRQFHRSPVKRTKQSGLVRNANAVLESQQTSE